MSNLIQPSCHGAESQVISIEGNRLVGKLTLAKSGIRQSFVTENHLAPSSWMSMNLVDGPFHSLEAGGIRTSGR